MGLAFDEEQDVLHQAQQTAIVTHDHPEGIEGAQAVALAVFKARQGHSKEQIREIIQSQFGYRWMRQPTTFGQATASTSLAKDPCPRQSSPSWILRMSKTPFASLSHWEGIATHKRQSQAALHTRSLAIPAEIVDGVRQRLPIEFWTSSTSSASATL